MPPLTHWGDHWFPELDHHAGNRNGRPRRLESQAWNLIRVARSYVPTVCLLHAEAHRPSDQRTSAGIMSADGYG